MMIIFSFLIALSATLIFAFLIWWVDLWEREPLREALLRVVYGGIPAILYTGIADLVFYFIPLPEAVIKAPLVEEFVKGLGVFFIFSAAFQKLFSSQRQDGGSTGTDIFFINLILWLGSKSSGEQELDSPLDGLVYGALVGFGFAFVEDLTYYADFRGTGYQLLTFVFQRSILFGFGHAYLTGLVGLSIGLGRAKGRWWRWVLPAGGYAAAVVLHSSFNRYALLGSYHMFLAYAYGLGALVVAVSYCLMEERRWIKEELSDEVARGILTPEHVRLAADYGYRLGVDSLMLGRNRQEGWKKYQFLQACSELAFKKRRLKQAGHRAVGLSTLEELRHRVYALRDAVAADL